MIEQIPDGEAVREAGDLSGGALRERRKVLNVGKVKQAVG